MKKTPIKFEYLKRYFGAHEMDEVSMIPFLNDEGKAGWELVYIIRNMMIHEPHVVANYSFIFKRVKP